jgi:hypothetical protein
MLPPPDQPPEQQRYRAAAPHRFHKCRLQEITQIHPGKLPGALPHGTPVHSRKLAPRFRPFGQNQETNFRCRIA